MVLVYTLGGVAFKLDWYYVFAFVIMMLIWIFIFGKRLYRFF